MQKCGKAIRMEVSALRVMGRATQGVRLINIKDSDSIAAVTKVMKEDEEEIDEKQIDTENDGTNLDNNLNASTEEGDATQE